MGVVGVAIAAAVALAVRDPDQPATLRRQPRREARAKRKRQSATTSTPATVTLAEPVERGGGLAEHWVPVPAGMNVWLRVRSGFVLTILLAVLGALLAVSVSGLVLFIALAVRNAVS